MRKTKIIATVGPACGSEAKLEALITAGVDIFRINASHTSTDGLKKWIRLIRKASASAKVQKAVSVLVDLQGPRLRTGSLKGEKIVLLCRGDKIALMPGNKPGDENTLYTSCRAFPSMVKKRDRILMDNGLLELAVQKINGTRVDCQVIRGGKLGENKGINLPNAPVTLPVLSAKDKADLHTACRMSVDYIALSFVRHAQDVRNVKEIMKRARTEVPVIAKIEKPRAINDIQDILRVADGIMVARGDLGIELGVEKVPMIQKQLIDLANHKSVPVVTATQMLESMMASSTPSRAEVSDIANAVLDGTDAVMLSGETAVGKYPVECVRMMAQIIMEAEKNMSVRELDTVLNETCENRDLPIHAITLAARNAANDMDAKAIVVFTLGGKTAALVSKFRPNCPVIVLTPSDKVSRKLNLFRGVIPFKVKYQRSVDRMLREGDKTILKTGRFKKGDVMVVVSGRQAFPGSQYMTQIHHLGEI